MLCHNAILLLWIHLLLLFTHLWFVFVLCCKGFSLFVFHLISAASFVRSFYAMSRYKEVNKLKKKKKLIKNPIRNLTVDRIQTLASLWQLNVSSRWRKGKLLLLWEIKNCLTETCAVSYIIKRHQDTGKTTERSLAVLLYGENCIICDTNLQYSTTCTVLQVSN